MQDESFYSDVVKSHNKTHDTIMEALAVVESFIIEKQRIVVGGFSIDAALQLHGESLYSAHTVPDYDIYSPAHYEDACILADILHKMNFHNISVINAYHPSTMRVRVDFEVVADITYAPQHIYEKLPHIAFKGLRIIHPHFQMIDQHRSLSHPFDKPGREVIFERWKKDMTRYDLLYNHYPVGVSDFKPAVEISRTSRNLHILRKSSDVNTIKFLTSKLKGSCLCGWGSVGYSLEGKFILLKIPSGEPVTVACDDLSMWDMESEMYEDLFDKIPRKKVIRDISFLLSDGGEIVDELGKSVSPSDHYLEVLDTSDRKISATVFGSTYICNLQYSMLYLMVKVFMYDGGSEIKQMAKEIYLICRDLVFRGEYPSIETYGRFNVPITLFNSRSKTKEQIYKIKPDMKLQQPNNYYPARNRARVKFDYAGKEFFKIGGERTNKFIEHTDNPYPEFTTSSSLRTF